MAFPCVSLLRQLTLPPMIQTVWASSSVFGWRRCRPFPLLSSIYPLVGQTSSDCSSHPPRQGKARQKSAALDTHQRNSACFLLGRALSQAPAAKRAINQRGTLDREGGKNITLSANASFLQKGCQNPEPHLFNFPPSSTTTTLGESVSPEETFGQFFSVSPAIQRLFYQQMLPILFVHLCSAP